MERVLATDDEENGVRSEVVELTSRPWLGSITASAVQIRIGGLDEDDEPRDH